MDSIARGFISEPTYSFYDRVAVNLKIVIHHRTFHDTVCIICTRLMRRVIMQPPSDTGVLRGDSGIDRDISP